jgi:hypothetical protein
MSTRGNGSTGRKRGSPIDLDDLLRAAESSTTGHQAVVQNLLTPGRLAAYIDTGLAHLIS